MYYLFIGRRFHKSSLMVMVIIMPPLSFSISSFKFWFKKPNIFHPFVILRHQRPTLDKINFHLKLRVRLHSWRTAPAVSRQRCAAVVRWGVSSNKHRKGPIVWQVVNVTGCALVAVDHWKMWRAAAAWLGLQRSKGWRSSGTTVITGCGGKHSVKSQYYATANLTTTGHM